MRSAANVTKWDSPHFRVFQEGGKITQILHYCWIDRKDLLSESTFSFHGSLQADHQHFRGSRAFYKTVCQHGMLILCSRAGWGSLATAASILSHWNQVIGKVKVRNTYKLEDLGGVGGSDCNRRPRHSWWVSPRFWCRGNDAWALLELCINL